MPNTNGAMLIELLSNAYICGSRDQVVNVYLNLRRPSEVCPGLQMPVSYII